jgi:hypothetical protein
VEITSEDPAHPIESALVLNAGGFGWRAATAGEQTLRIRFDRPQRVSHIRLVFEEREEARMQEFVLRWSSAGAPDFREILRQQYNFSPLVTTTEVEDYDVELTGVLAIDLIILPDVQRGNARASLKHFRLAS